MSTTYRTIEERVHPWTYHEFEKDRKEQVECAVEIIKALDYNSNVLVSAPVKSGKRQIAEIVALAYAKEGNQNKHYFITALNRLDTKNQKEELSKYNLDVKVLSAKKDLRDLLQQLKTASEPNNIIVHFDESDYGTGIKNLFKNVFDVCKKRKIKLVCYSATNEEAEKSGFALVAKIITMIPNKLYKGAEWFLDNNLVHEPQPFFDGKDITQHGKDILDWWSVQDEPIAILRLSGGEKDKSLYTAFEDSSAKDMLVANKISPRFINGSHSFDWMEKYKDLLVSFEKHGVRTLLVINQTCTRSTELGFHKHLAFLHDYRNGESNYGTLAQAYLRVAHYDPEGHRIQVYGNKEVFELAAKRIAPEEYNGRLGARVSKITMKGGNNILLKSEEHFFKPEETINIVGLSLDQQKEIIYSIWNSHIKLAKEKIGYNGKDEVDSRLSLKKDSTFNRWLPFESEALGGKTIITKKRHLFSYNNNYTEIIVKSIFHDGKEGDVKESTTHLTSQNSVFQT